MIRTDDLDGSEGAQTVAFGFEGASYEIDLSAKNRARLEKALAAFIAAGRKAPRRGRARGRTVRVAFSQTGRPSGPGPSPRA